MSKLSGVWKALVIMAALAACVGAQEKRSGPFAAAGDSFATADDAFEVTSPDRRFLVRFSSARSGGNGPGRLWGKISVRDLGTGAERIVREAQGKRGTGVFEGFSLYDDGDAWSPDGRYLAYWDDFCVDEPGVESGVVCHLHEVRFLSLKPLAPCREELTLSRYEFGGWVRGRAHTVWKISVNEAGERRKVSPCRRGRK